MKLFPRKLRRKIKRFRSSELVALITIIQLVFPHSTAFARTPVRTESVEALPAAIAIVEPAPVVPNLELGQLPETANRPVQRTMTLSVTAYSSTVDQTDGDPFTAASGERVFDGMIAYNGLPFGTKVRFPDYFGDKVFVVLDRMNARKGPYVADIWMPTREQAKQWGVRVTRMEILN